MIVSFIIVAYNAENSINNIFKNLVAQDYNHKMIEVVLVDSNSSDRTKIIMDDFKNEYYNEFKRIIVLENIKKTLPYGWNVALKEVKGDIILRVDAHAIIPNNFISKNMDNIVKGEYICGGKVTSIACNNSKWQETLLQVENSLFGGGIAKFRKSEASGYVSTLAFAAYKRSVFETVGGYDERLARTEDNEMHYRMRRAGYKFFFNPEIQSYRESRNSLQKLIKQKYLNGYWIGLTMGIEPRCFELYHFIPFIFVIAIFISTIISIFISSIPLYLLALLYFGFAIINTIITIARNKQNRSFYIILLPLLFFIFHISYGVGTCCGLLKMPFWKLQFKE